MTTINIRVDENVKQQASELFEALGLDMSTAMNLFLRQAINYGGIPFEIRKPHPCAVASKTEIFAKLKEAENEIESGANAITHEKLWADMRAKYGNEV
ncbi:MAG: type II toxin-antitoxin system RelB/DinJ family antitoxin [Clostridia bacterium]|nr:type II toxin-antitoxin system RelB/DinJ family antitoxin [Clostridia bacterium]